MNRFYFLQEAIVGGPFMLFLILIALGSLFFAFVIVIYTLSRMKSEVNEFKNTSRKKVIGKNVIEDYKNGNLKPDGSYLIINIGLAVMLIIAAILIFIYLASIKFD